MIPSDKGREPPYWEIVSGDETTMVREVLRWPMLYGFAYSQSAQWGDFQHYSDEQLRERVEQGRRAGAHFVAFVQPVAADKYIGFARHVRLILHHDRRVGR